MRKNKGEEDIFEEFGEDDLESDDYKQLFSEKKKELLLDNRRARVTTMSFHDWFVKAYKRDYKQSDKHISDAYHAGAADEIENNEYIIDHTELKMNHYKGKALKLADQVQIFHSLLEHVAKKSEITPAIRKLITKALSEY